MTEETRSLLLLLKDKEREIKNLKKLIERDFLTGLYNRRGFVNEAQKFLDEIKVSAKIGERRKPFIIKNLSIIFIDLDNIKIVNDNFGHEAGDKILKKVAALFKRLLRGSDILSRWGGDEFVIALLGISERKAFQVAEKLRREVAALKINFKNKKIGVTASFGVIAALTKNKKRINFDINEMIDKADKLMYKAKKEFNKNFVATLHKQ